MEVIYGQQTHRQIPESMATSQSDDAWHPLEDRNYIEWWYFDVVGADGSITRGQFHISGDVSRPGKVRTGVRASYLRPDGTENRIDEKFPYASFKSSTEVCEVEIGSNFLKGDLSHYRLHIEDRDKALDLELDSEISGFTSHACFGDETKYMFWVVPQPRGHAKGTFRTRGETFNIDGVGYRDHNWLNMPPMDFLSQWDWGRICDKEFTVIFADIVTTRRFDNAEIKPLMVFDSGKLLYLTTKSDKWSLAKGDIKFDPVAQTGFPRKHLIRLQDEDLSLEIDLDLKKVFQRIDPLADFNPLSRFIIRTFKANPAITSFLSTGSGKLDYYGRQDSLTCTAIHEFVKNSK